MYILKMFGRIFSWSLFYVWMFPDLCFSAQIRHVDPPTVYAETVLHAVYKTLLDGNMLHISAQVIFEVICTTPVYDPDYHVCIAAIAWLARLSRYLPEAVRSGCGQYLALQPPPFLVESALVLKRCIFTGITRQLWETHYIMFDFPDPNAIIERNVIFIFVKFFLGAPPYMVCVYWVLIILYEYIFKYQKKVYDDLLLLCVVGLLFVAIVEWMENLYVLSLTYIFISYLTYIYYAV